jgi:RluA family pseudouridine synthase
MYDRENTVHNALNQYVQKGNPKSHKRVFVVHRLDRETSGVLIFAKTEQAQIFLKNRWPETVKTYFAVVHGLLKNKTGTISSYLEEDEEYRVHSSLDESKGKLAHTGYEVIQETSQYSLLKINLITGLKNQIRVHLAAEGHPVVGDSKYGKGHFKYMALHASSISFTHPSNKKITSFETPLPDYFATLVGSIK